VPEIMLAILELMRYQWAGDGAVGDEYMNWAGENQSQHV